VLKNSATNISFMSGSYKCTACIRPYINPNWPTGKISLERLAANAKVATVLVSIPVSSETVESEVAADE
jgi:hypothetical protein